MDCELFVAGSYTLGQQAKVPTNSRTGLFGGLAFFASTTNSELTILDTMLDMYSGKSWRLCRQISNLLPIVLIMESKDCKVQR